MGKVVHNVLLPEIKAVISKMTENSSNAMYGIFFLLITHHIICSAVRQRPQNRQDRMRMGEIN